MLVSRQPLHKRRLGQELIKLIGQELIKLKHTWSFIQIWTSDCQYVFTYFCLRVFT